MTILVSLGTQWAPEDTDGKNLTDRFCETTKSKGRRLEIFDTNPNAWHLIFRVSPTAKSWAVRYRISGKRKLRTIGSYPGVSLKKARAKSLEYASQIADGIDPEQAERESEVAAMTFGDLAGEYITHCKKHQRSWKETERIFDNHILPVLKDEPLTEVGREKTLNLQQTLEDKGLTTQVNRVTSQVKACLSWAVEDRQYLEANPIATLQRKKRRVVETTRDRILNRDELKAVWQAADGLTEPSKSLVKMLMLTGQRRDEVRCMTRFEVDIADSNWILSAKRTKAKRAHLVPLSEYAVGILKSNPDFEDGKFVFTVDGEKPYAGVRRLKEILDRESKVSDWVFHDLRRTFSTGLSALNVEPHIRRRCLNHSVGSALDRTYDLYDFQTEKRAAMDAWTEYLLRAVGEIDDSNVVEFAAAGGDG